MAGHQLCIGNFYYQNRNYRAAVKRYRQLLDQYPSFSQRDRVHFFLGRSYFYLEERNKARENFLTLLKRYPKSEFAETSKALLADLKKNEPLKEEKRGLKRLIPDSFSIPFLSHNFIDFF